MASKQYEDKGTRSKTFPSQGGGSTSTQNMSEHQRISQGSGLESDAVPNSVASPMGQYQGGGFSEQIPYGASDDSHAEFQGPQPHIVDVVVIYSKEDYEAANDKFIPWLKERAMGINEPDARIYLYDDFSLDLNLFRKTEDMATRCMKILVYITEHFMADTELKSIVEELICLTKFGNSEEVKQHISNIYKLGSYMGIERNPLESLTECVLQQKKNALMPVQTTEKKIGFTGLLAIHPIIQFFAVEKNKKYKEKIASNVIKAAIDDRRKYQQGQQNATRQSLQALYHDSHKLQVSQMNRNTQPSPSAVNENQEGRDMEPSSDGLPASSKAVCEGSDSKGTSLEDNAPRDKISGLNVSEQNSESDHAGDNNQQHAHETSENAELFGAGATDPNEDISKASDLETDRMESSKHCDNMMTESGYQSGCNSLTEVKIPHHAVGHNKPKNDSGEESLDDKSLVNDFGEAANDSSESALKNKNQIPQQNDDQLCTDASTCDSKPNNAGSYLVNDSGTEAEQLNATHEKLKTKDYTDHESEVMEHTVKYSSRGRPVSRGVMAGNSPSKGNLDGSPPINPPPYTKDNPVGSSQNQLLNLLTAGAVLTVHHHHHYEKPEPPQPPPPETKRAAAEVPPTINVYGANSVVIGKNSQAILADSTMISNISSDTTENDNSAPKDTTEKDTGKKMDDIGEDAVTPSMESFNDLSSNSPSTYNFPMSAESSTKEFKTDSDKVDKTAHQNEETKIFDDNSSSDDSVKDSSPVSTAEAHQGYESNHSRSEHDIDRPMKKTTDTKGLKENKSHITAEDDLPSSEGNQSWQSEAELVLGPSMGNDFESLVEEERSVNPNLENSNDHEDTGIGSVNITDNSETATPPIPSGGAEYQCGAETSHLQFVSVQQTSLFSSVCIRKNFAQRCLRTNAVGMMVQTWDLPQSEKQDPKIQDDDID